MSAIPKEALPAIIERLKGGSSLGQEAKALGMSYRTTLITTLRTFMGRAEYDAMIEAKRPRTKAGVQIGSIDRPRPDDAGLPVVTSMGRTHGWSWRYVNEHEPRPVKVSIKEGTITVMDGGDKILIVCDPDGVEYVAADDTEKADLLRSNVLSEHGPRMRFVRWEHSKCRERVERNHRHNQDLLKQGEEAAAERRRAKKVQADPEAVQAEQAKHHKRIARKAAKEATPEQRVSAKLAAAVAAGVQAGKHATPAQDAPKPAPRGAAKAKGKRAAQGKAGSKGKRSRK